MKTFIETVPISADAQFLLLFPDRRSWHCSCIWYCISTYFDSESNFANISVCLFFWMPKITLVTSVAITSFSTHGCPLPSLQTIFIVVISTNRWAVLDKFITSFSFHHMQDGCAFLAWGNIPPSIATSIPTSFIYHLFCWEFRHIKLALSIWIKPSKTQKTCNSYSVGAYILQSFHMFHWFSGLHINELLCSMPKNCLLYNFLYASFGELPAYTVAWASLLDLTIAITTVAHAWSEHVV